MAISREIDINVTTNGMDDAINKTEKLGQATDQAADSSREMANAQNAQQQSVLDNGGAMGLLNDATGGYAMMVKDAVEASALFTKGTKAAAVAQKAYAFVVGASSGAMKLFRIALASTGIGIIVLAVVALITNFGKIKEVVTNLFPPLKFLTAIMGGIIDFVTDLIGVTSDASREMAKLSEEFAKTAKREELWLELNGDKYDEYTRRKLQAEQDFKKKRDEIINDQDENFTDEQKKEAIKWAEEKLQRDLIKIDQDAANERKKIEDERLDYIANKIDDFRKREEDAAAKTNYQKINLEEKRALEDLKAKGASLEDLESVQRYYDGRRKEEDARQWEERSKKNKERDDKERQRQENINKMLEDFRKRDEDAAADTVMKKIQLEQDRAMKELNLLKASEEEKRELVAYYDRQRAEAYKKQTADRMAIEKERQNALRTLELDQKQWEVDNMVDGVGKLEAQRKLLQEQAQLEIDSLNAVIENEQATEKERADARNNKAKVEQELKQSLADQDKKIAAQQKADLEAQQQLDKDTAQNRINIATTTAGLLADLGGKGAEFAKGMAASQAIQDTYAGATAAYKAMVGIPIVGPGLAVAAAGATVAAGLMNVKKILSTKPVEKSAPGGGGGAGAVPEAPAFNLVQGTGVNQIAESIANSGSTPIQAYVVSGNVTTAQGLERNIVDDSRI